MTPKQAREPKASEVSKQAPSARSEPKASEVGKQARSARSEPKASEVSSPGPPLLQPFGLVLHRDGSWTHEGHPFRHQKLRRLFDRSVRYLPDEGKYVVQVAHFRGEIELEETGFFVRSFDAERGEITLSDRSSERFDLGSLRTSAADGALVCTVKRDLVPDGLPARFSHAAQADLLAAVEEGDGGPVLRLAGTLHPFPEGGDQPRER